MLGSYCIFVWCGVIKGMANPAVFLSGVGFQGMANPVVFLRYRILEKIGK